MPDSKCDGAHTIRFAWDVHVMKITLAVHPGDCGTETTLSRTAALSLFWFIDLIGKSTCRLPQTGEPLYDNRQSCLRHAEQTGRAPMKPFIRPVPSLPVAWGLLDDFLLLYCF